MFVFNQYNYRAQPRSYQVFKKPSLTVPDQSMSIREIFLRYARGLPLGAPVHLAMFDEDDEFPDVSKMDFADRQAFLDEMKDEIELSQKKMEYFKQKQVEQRRKEDLEFFRQKRKDEEKKFRENQKRQLDDQNSK